MFYTYIHRRLDTNAVFYVGKGCRGRAFDRSGRSAHWKRVVGKVGHAIQILAHWATNAEAYAHEQFLISCFRGLGAPLVNRTDGGPGAAGFVTPPEVRAKQRAAKLGRQLSVEHRESISRAARGRAVTPETREKISAAHAGRRYPERSGPRDPAIAAEAGRAVRRLFADQNGVELPAEEWSRRLGVTIRSFFQLVYKRRYVNTGKPAGAML